MSCENPLSAFSIVLPNNDTEVRVLEADVRNQRRKYSRAELVTTEAAGELVAQYAHDSALAFLKLRGEPMRRMALIGTDAVEFDRTTREETKAIIDLQDPRKVLTQSTVEKSFKDVSAEKIVSYLLSQRHDPEGIIQGYNFINKEDARKREGPLLLSESIDFGGPIGEIIEAQSDLAATPGRLAEGILGHFGWADKAGLYSFDFNGETILEALSKKVMPEFGLNWWVDNDGILQIGPFGTRSRLHASQAAENNLALSRYSVTTAAKSINAVQIDAPLTDIVNRRNYPGVDLSSTKAIAEATAPEIDGGLAMPRIERSFSSLDEMERVAMRKLHEFLMQQSSGSVEINGLASKDIDGLRTMDVGDYIFFDKSISKTCEKDVITGTFMIMGVKHTTGPRVGWKIDVEVSRVPNPDMLLSSSVIYDATKDKEYETLGAFRESRDFKDAEDYNRG